MERERHERLVSASELGSYLYCSRKWWLRQQYGERDDDFSLALKEGGTEAHLAHGLQVASLSTSRRWASYLLLAALGTAALWLISLLISR